ncbi:hypothetical protein [Pseudogracilibacillus sp. SO30301A]|uniref:hypothetical protein n=1 Tax=Pseudogracilibacillus sp. SO30301A TaxID=3098291 RepID=UPI00300DC5D7
MEKEEQEVAPVYSNTVVQGEGHLGLSESINSQTSVLEKEKLVAVEARTSVQVKEKAVQRNKMI